MELKSELEHLRSIDASMRTVRNIMLWWLILSIVGAIIAALVALSRLQ